MEATRELGAPLLKQFQEPGHFFCSEFTVQISRSGFARDAERDIRPDHRACCCHRCVLVPWIAVAAGENSHQDVRSAKGRQRSAVQDGEEEEAQRSQVAEH